MYKAASVLSALCALAAAVPYPQNDAPSLDVNNPSGSDPTSPPSSLTAPSGAPENPYPSGIPTQPDECDSENPSEECFKAMGSGGYLWFAKDSQCDDTQKSKLQTAVWDATTLASYSSNFPGGVRGQASGIFYMGPDFATQTNRIAGNLKRAWQFKTSSTSDSAYITTSCKDTKNYCSRTIEGKGVGGYAWTYNGWWAYYHYITLCPPFFSLETLGDKLDEIEGELASGNADKARDMRYLRSTGQYFLHEMMHTRIADGGVEPHIIDEYVAPIPKGEKPGTNDVRAYGPRLVHNLARRSLSNGGGATRASTNADSYAMLANAAWWWDVTGYFPGVPGKSNPSAAQDDSDPDQLVSIYIDIDNGTDPTTLDFTSLFDADLQTFGNGPPELDEPVGPSNGTTSAAPSPTPVPSTTAAPPETTAPPATAAAPAPEPTCPVSNDDHWPTCDECPDGWNPDKCVASEASAACSCNDPCGDTNCIL